MNAQRFLLPGLALLASCQSVPEKHPAHSAAPKGPDGTEPALRRLVTPALQQEMGANGFTDPEVLAPAAGDPATTTLPAASVGLTAEGLTFHYTDYELGAYAYGMPLVTIPWPTVQPLLRPDSPVARMLRERGLWSATPKK